jgi:hypothetical protein
MGKKTYEYMSILIGLFVIAIAWIGNYTKTFTNIGVHTYVAKDGFMSLTLYPNAAIILLSALGMSFGLYYSISKKKMSIGLIINAAILIFIAASRFAEYYVRETI